MPQKKFQVISLLSIILISLAGCSKGNYSNAKSNTAEIACLLLFSVSGCGNKPTDSPEIKQALNQANEYLNQCLIEAMINLDDGTTDPAILSRAMASSCQHTALTEAQKLRRLNANKHFIQGYVNEYTRQSSIENIALTLILSTRKKFYQEMLSERLPQEG